MRNNMQKALLMTSVKLLIWIMVELETGLLWVSDDNNILILFSLKNSVFKAFDFDSRFNLRIIKLSWTSMYIAVNDPKSGFQTRSHMLRPGKTNSWSRISSYYPSFLTDHAVWSLQKDNSASLTWPSRL